MNVVQLCATADEMDMGIVETWKKQFSRCVDELYLRTTPGVYFGIATYGHDAVAKNRDGLGSRAGGIDGPDVGMSDDQVSGRLGLGLSYAQAQA